MTPYQLFVLALRIVGFWVVIPISSGIGYAVGTLMMLTSMTATGQGKPEQFGVGDLLLSVFLPLVIQGGVGLMFVLGAPRIAALFYSRESDPQTPANAANFAFEDVSRIAVRILGIYAALLAAKPVATILFSFTGQPYQVENSVVVRAWIETGLYLAVGGLLLFNTKIHQAISGKPGTTVESYDPSERQDHEF
jgi:hypothetical protein